MGRMLTFSIVLGVWSLAAWSGTPAGFAQEAPGTAQVRQPRPQPADLQVQKLPPALEQLLNAWSQHSAQIQKLQGEHYRHVYDLVYNVEKRSMGVFYYEAPNKGRIDLKPANIKGEVSLMKGKDGKPFKLQADRAERWICDGQSISQVNDATKQVDVIKLPKESQGENIMDGPMPFLFGMPPEKAKMRYVLQLVKEDPQQAWIKVLPRWQVDAANWREAWVILDKKLYLPTAVKLVDPAGNQETTYRFHSFKINEPNHRNWIDKVFNGDADPFRPKLTGYAVKVHDGSESRPSDKPVVPSLAGLNWKDAETLVKKLNCQVKIQRGQQAPRPEMNYVVYQQNPKAETPLQQGQEFVLTVYDEAPKQPQQPPQPQQQPGQVPKVLGMFWKQAGAQLEQAGYKVKYLPGKAAPQPDDTYKVYEQKPNAGQPLKPGSEVTLTVYNKTS